MLLSRPPKNPLLSRFIEAFWACETHYQHELERVLPNGRTQMFINLFEDNLHHYATNGALQKRASGMVLQGPALSPVVIDRAEQRGLCGVLFSPGGAFPFFRLPMTEIGASLVDLDSLTWEDQPSLRERLATADGLHARLDVLEAAFLKQAPAMQNWDVIISESAALLKQGWQVRSLVDRFDTTPQTFISRFRERVGMTPKTYAQIERFQRLIRSRSSATSWADAAIDVGFADQPHMVRAFRRFGGMTPSSYKPPNPATPNHLPISA